MLLLVSTAQEKEVCSIVSGAKLLARDDENTYLVLEKSQIVMTAIQFSMNMAHMATNIDLSQYGTKIQHSGVSIALIHHLMNIPAHLQ